MHIFGRILAVLGILALIGLVTGAAYSAGLAASGAAASPAAYGLGFGFFGFGLFHFFGFILFFFLLFGLLRLALGGRRGWAGRGQMGGGWGHGYGPGPGGSSQTSGDPREAWIRGRLEEWHRTAHAPESGSSTQATPSTDPNPPA
jgi:hypothetical protein